VRLGALALGAFMILGAVAAFAECDYLTAGSPGCAEKGYPNARPPQNPIWSALANDVAAAEGIARQFDLRRADLIKKKEVIARDCSTWLGEYAPACGRRRQEFAELNAETMAAYNLYPAAGALGVGGERPPLDWNPRYSEKEVLDPKTGHWRRHAGNNPPNGGMDDNNGRIAIFRAAIKTLDKNNLGGPDRLAAIILHETIHWVDRKAYDGRFWTHEAHRTEARAIKAEIDFVARIRRETGRPVFEDKTVTELEGRVLHHQEALRHIPDQDSWIGIAEKYWIPRILSQEKELSDPEGSSAEILKSKAGMDFAAAWDRRAGDLLERIGEYNTRLDEENRFRKEAQGQWRREQAFNRLSAFSAKVCSHGDGLERVMVPMQELEQIWVELGPETYGTDPDPFLGYWDCAVWLPRKLARLHAQGERCPDPNVLLALLQRHDEATEKVKRGDPVAAPPPPRAAPRIPPAVATPPSRQNSSTGVPVQNRPEPPERERCRYQGDWCR